MKIKSLKNTHHFFTIILLATSMLAFNSCKDKEELNGTYDIIEVNKQDRAAYEMTLSINMGETENRINGFSGCNSYFGSFKLIDGDRIELGPIAGSKKYCKDTASIEDNYLRFLNMVKQARIKDDMLELLNAQEQVIIKASKQ